MPGPEHVLRLKPSSPFKHPGYAPGSLRTIIDGILQSIHMGGVQHCI